MLSYFRFRYHRGLRRFRRRARTLSQWSTHYVQRHVYGTWRKLWYMGWRFYILFVALVISFFGLLAQINHLDNIYLTSTPKAGGTYSEGLIGDVKQINPILLDTPAETDVSKLVFAGLTQYDSAGHVAPALAQSWEVSADYKTYTFHLQPHLLWQDAAPLTADDVAFTVGMIQNPDTRSNLRNNWQGVKTEVVDPSTVRFTLPNSYPAFLSATTVGILPKHLLSDTQAANLRLSEYNSHPVGAGPFAFDSQNQSLDMVLLDANPHYYAGPPQIQSLKIYLFHDDKSELEAYAKKRIMGFGGFAASDLKSVKKFRDVKVRQLNQPDYLALFFNTQVAKLQDASLRLALAQSIDRHAIIQLPTGMNGQAKAVSVPLDVERLGIHYTSKNTFDLAAAKAGLQAQTGGQRLSLTLVTHNSPELLATADEIKRQFAQAGVDIQVHAYDLDTLQQNYIRPRKYDLLLYGENVGADQDVYNFWHSSQAADPGLNLSGYKNPAADRALESARLAKDPDNKRAKELAFLQTWDSDVPAVILASPYYLYAQDKQVWPSAISELIAPPDRFYNIQTWAVHSTQTLKAKVH